MNSGSMTAVSFHLEPIPGNLRSGFVSGSTPVALLDGKRTTVAELLEDLQHGVHHTTFSLQPDGQVHSVHVNYVRRAEGDAEVLDVRLDDGEVLHCTPHQLVLVPPGRWVEVHDLRPGDALLTVRDPHQWAGKPYTTDLHADLDHHRRVESVTRDGTLAVYEFQVDRLHNIAHPSGIFLHD